MGSTIHPGYLRFSHWNSHPNPGFWWTRCCLGGVFGRNPQRGTKSFMWVRMHSTWLIIYVSCIKTNYKQSMVVSGSHQKGDYMLPIPPFRGTSIPTIETMVINSWIWNHQDSLWCHLYKFAQSHASKGLYTLGGKPHPRIPVANEGLVWDPLLKM